MIDRGYPTVVAYERGDVCPPIHVLEKIADATHVPISAFFDAETKEQALDLVAAMFTRAGARLPSHSILPRGKNGRLAAPRDLSERKAA